MDRYRLARKDEEGRREVALHVEEQVEGMEQTGWLVACGDPSPNKSPVRMTLWYEFHTVEGQDKEVDRVFFKARSWFL